MTLLDLGFALTQIRRDTVTFYDRLAPRFERTQQRWLRAGGSETMAALHGCLNAELRPGARVLDAGCGTGTLARWILAQEPRAQITQLDAATGMLARARTVHHRAVLANLLALPFSDDSFHVVVCAWALETVSDPERVLRELKRVLAPGGLLCCCHCTRPASRWVRFRSLALRLSVTHLFKGRFLPMGTAGSLDGGRVRWVSCHDGLSAFVCYRKRLGDEA